MIRSTVDPAWTIHYWPPSKPLEVVIEDLKRTAPACGNWANVFLYLESSDVDDLTLHAQIQGQMKGRYTPEKTWDESLPLWDSLCGKFEQEVFALRDQHSR